MIDTTNSQSGSVVGMWRRALPWAALAVAFSAFFLAYFSPALLRGLMLAPGDGQVYYAPLFGLSATSLWNRLILSGYPVVADIQAQTLYPLRWLSPTYNLLVLAGYLVAAVGMFGLVHRLTHSRLSGFLAALTLSTSGFLVGHLGHLSILHAAAWIPWILWAVAALRTHRDWLPVAGGAIAVSLSLLGGHPQISVLGLLLAGCYAVHELGVVARGDGIAGARRLLLRIVLMFALGIVLSLPALVPTLQAARDSVRGGWSISDFDSFSHDLASLRLMFFPNLYGSYPIGPYGNYGGPWNLTELAIYAGILPWFLMIAAVLGWRRNRAPLFWLGVLLISLLLTLGSATPLGKLLYELPVVGKFRAQARYGLLVIIALSVLAGFGLSAILRGAFDRRRAGLLIASCGVSAALMTATLVHHDQGQAPLASIAVYVPLAMMLLSTAAVAYLVLKPGVRPAMLALLLLAVDLASFGWFYEWRYASPSAQPEQMATDEQALVGEIQRGPGRVLPLDAAMMPPNAIRPNLNLRHGIASVVGYGPLLSARYARFSGTDTVGNFAERRTGIPLLDVLGVQWIARMSPGSMEAQLLGSGCGAPFAQTAIEAIIPADVAPRGLRIISHMSCSPQIPSGTTVADVRVGEGGTQPGAVMSLEAGEDTSEWAYDRPDVNASIAHARARVAESFDAGGFRGLWFDARWPSTQPLPPGRRIEIRLRSTDVLMRVKAIEVLDAAGRWIALPMAPADDTGQASLSPVRSLPGIPEIRQRLSFRGLAWGVCDTRPVSADEIFVLLRGGKDAGGLRFDPFYTALVEPNAALPPPDCPERPRIKVVARSDGRWRLQSIASGTSVLVVSESYNPGWRARIDGRSAPVVPIDGLIMGVSVPAGMHEVALDYRPRLFRLFVAAAVSALTAIGMMVFASWRRSIEPRPVTPRRNA